MLQQFLFKQPSIRKLVMIEGVVARSVLERPWGGRLCRVRRRPLLLVIDGAWKLATMARISYQQLPSSLLLARPDDAKEENCKPSSRSIGHA